MRRRDILAFLGASALWISGCTVDNDGEITDTPTVSQSQSSTDTPSTTPSETITPRRTFTTLREDAMLATKQVSPESPPAGPITVADLPQKEQTVVKEAIQTGTYQWCDPSDSESFESLQERIINQAPEEEYFQYNDDLYGIWLSHSDVVSASTAPPPDDSRWDSC